MEIDVRRGEQKMDRFRSMERVGAEEESTAVPREVVEVVERVVGGLRLERSTGELRVLARRLYAVWEDRDGERARRFLPDELERARFANYTTAAARLIRQGRALPLAAVAHRRCFIAQAHVLEDELLERLRERSGHVDLSGMFEETGPAFSDDLLQDQLTERLPRPRLRSPMEDLAQATFPVSAEPWDLGLDSEDTQELSTIADLARSASASSAAHPPPTPSRPRPRSHSVTFRRSHSETD